MHEKIERLTKLHDEALGDTWALVDGGTGAVVAPTDPRPGGVDHERYWGGEADIYPPGTEVYPGGTLICESTRGNHAEVIVEMYNTVPDLIRAIETMHVALRAATTQKTADIILNSAMEGRGA